MADTDLETMAEGLAPRLLCERDAARYVAMSRTFLRKSRMDGNRHGRTAAPPWLRVGRSVRYDLRDLDAWIEARKQYPRALAS